VFEVKEVTESLLNDNFEEINYEFLRRIRIASIEANLGCL
jgi:hypothetical protein